MNTNTAISNISLYIPHIFANYSEGMVAQVFEDLNIGKVKNIDFVSKMGQDGKEYHAAYIHFDYWCDTIAARNFQARVIDSKLEARVVYDEPWYWIVLENKSRKFVPGERKVRIDLGVPATPVRSVSVAAPPAPVKETRTLAQVVNTVPIKLEQQFTVASCEADVAAPIQTKVVVEDEEDPDFLALCQEIEECEHLWETEAEDLDSNMTYVDIRYLQALESENNEFRNYNFYLNNELQRLSEALRNEESKTQALAEAIKLVSSLKN
jgi:hypothetical protein